MIDFKITYQIVDSLLLSIILILTSVMLIVVSPGFVLGPLLFLIHVNDIANASPNSDIRLFADDTNVFLLQNLLAKLILKLKKLLKNSISGF